MNSRLASKIKTATELADVRAELCRNGKTLVWTNGCFDLLHVGHVRSLQSARALGDALVVGLNSDDSVRRIKGEGRPIVPAAERVEMLAALECVDFVTVFEAVTPDEVLRIVQPGICCKGEDYAPSSGRALPEADLIRSFGGQIRFLPLVPGLSTTQRVASLIAAHKNREG